MNRKQFLQQFNDKFPCHNGICMFNVDITVYDSKLEIQQGIHKLFEVFFANLGVNNPKAFLNSIENNSNFDFDYDEEEPDSPFCRYNCKFNLNQVYEQFILQGTFDLEVTDIYRIENTKGEGLYSSRISGKLISVEHHPCPYEDSAFKNIFDDRVYSKNEEYKREWHFAFGKIEDAKLWLNKGEYIEKLKEEGFSLMKITIPTAFVVQGDRQAIFKPEHIIYKKALDLTLLKIENKRALKL